MVIVGFLVILIFIVEPEKLKYLSYFATFVLLLALGIMWTKNIIRYVTIPKKPYLEIYNFKYVGDLIGN